MNKTAVVGLGGLALVAGLAGASFWGNASGASSWTELDSVSELKERFNRDRGVTRVVLLLSPT